MIQLLQNPELRRSMTVLIPASVVACIAGFYLSFTSGLLVLALCLLFLISFFSMFRQRYAQMRALNDQLDLALHGEDVLQLSACQEGELAILKTQLQKLILRLRENATKSQQDKEFLSDSLADISHQLRTPLTSLNLIGVMLAESREDAARHQQLLQQLSRLLQRIDWLVDALLKLSKLDTGTAYFQNETLQAQKILQNAAQPLAVAMDVRGQQLFLTGQGTYNGDAAWSAEAFGNLLKNCMEHTPAGSVIEAEITQTPLFTQVVICDNGPGFAEQDLPHLFERFYKGEQASAASFGIGLALAQRIITAQNGTIQAKNRPEGGAMFCVRFYHSVI